MEYEYESRADRNINLSVKEYFNKIKPYLRDSCVENSVNNCN